MTAARTLVSGGTGFVGRFIVEELLAAGHQVAVMGRTPPSDSVFSASVTFVEGLLAHTRDQSHLFKNIDYFVHAALDHLPGKYRGGEGADRDAFWCRNRHGTIALFNQAKMSGVRRAVFLSSRAVYGTQPPGEVLFETTRPHPDTLYGEAKLAAEHHLRRMSDKHGFAGTSLRLTGVYGPAPVGKEHKWAGLFRDYLAGDEIEPRAGTEVHGADVAAVVRFVLEAPLDLVAGEVFNVSDLLVDRRDILVIVQRATGCPHPLPERADVSLLNVMATEKLEELGWVPGGKALFEQTVLSLIGGDAQRACSNSSA
jgi:nucleoside-diphosphate-sugar epimerase